MLIDTHCHVNLIVKNSFDTSLSQEDFINAKKIIEEAEELLVTRIVTIGTSFIESINCVQLAQKNNSVYAVVGIHPNDAQEQWQEDIKKLSGLLKEKEKNKIVGIGECGFDKHYPDYNITRQKDVFRAQIELALEHDLPLVIHTRNAHDDVLTFLEEYKSNSLKAVIHCFSEDLAFAQRAISAGYFLGVGGTATYPKNNELRAIIKTVGIESVVLETDAPFLPPQAVRGKQNRPAYIPLIANFLAELCGVSFEHIAHLTTRNTLALFGNLP